MLSSILPHAVHQKRDKTRNPGTPSASRVYIPMTRACSATLPNVNVNCRDESTTKVSTSDEELSEARNLRVKQQRCALSARPERAEV